MIALDRASRLVIVGRKVVQDTDAGAGKRKLTMLHVSPEPGPISIVTPPLERLMGSPCRCDFGKEFRYEGRM